MPLQRNVSAGRKVRYEPHELTNAARKKPTRHAEIRKLQRIQAVLICMQYAANEGAEFDVAGALLVVIELLDDALASIDALGGAGMNLSYETANIEQDIRTLENSIEVLSRVIACQTRG